MMQNVLSPLINNANAEFACINAFASHESGAKANRILSFSEIKAKAGYMNASFVHPWGVHVTFTRRVTRSVNHDSIRHNYLPSFPWSEAISLLARKQSGGFN